MSEEQRLVTMKQYQYGGPLWSELPRAPTYTDDAVKKLLAEEFRRGWNKCAEEAEGIEFVKVLDSQKRKIEKLQAENKILRSTKAGCHNCSRGPRPTPFHHWCESCVKYPEGKIMPKVDRWEAKK
jgi:hypothetical protein